MTWDMQTAARTLAQEARGEPIEGQTAVAWVFKNRLASGKWGRSLASVCLWRAQFSGWNSADPNFAYACGLRDDDPVLLHMIDILNAVLASSTDPTGGATFYFADSMTSPPAWAATMTFCGHFGHQKFYKP